MLWYFKESFILVSILVDETVTINKSKEWKKYNIYYTACTREYTVEKVECICLLKLHITVGKT